MEESARRVARNAGALLLVSFALTASGQPAGNETLRIGGTGAALGTMRALGGEFAKTRAGVQVKVLPYIGSGGALKGVDSGALDIGLSGRPAKPEEQKLKVVLTRYASTPFVLAAHPGVAVSDISRAQLVTIYAGTRMKWNDGSSIRLIVRPRGESDNDVLRTLAPDMGAALDAALARKGLHSAPTDQDAADALERTPGSIGTTTLSLVVSEKRKLKVLSLDGVKPSVKAIADGSYPYSKPLYLVTSPSPSPTVKAFVDFVRSPRGQALLSDHAQLPLKD